MSQPKDIDGHTPSEAELMLVDLLYGELDEDERARAADRVEDSGLGGELEKLRELRGLLRELPEEEPPASVTSKLLHAAAVNAPAKKAEGAGSADKKGLKAWLISLVRPIAMYPGLAAATSAVLVVGLAGALYLSGRDQLADPETPPAPAEKTAGRAAPVERPADLVARSSEETRAEQAGQKARGDVAAGEPMQAAAEAEADDALALAPQQQARPEKSAERQQSAKRDRSPRKRERRARTKSRTRAAPERDSSGSGVVGGILSKKQMGKGRSARIFEGEFATAPESSAGAGNKLSDKRAAGTAGGTQQAKKKAAPSSAGGTRRKAKKPAPARRAPAPSVPAGQRAYDREEANEPAPESKDEDADTGSKEAAGVRARVRSLHQKARSAAKREDCKTVRKIAVSIRELDGGYYRRAFQKDEDLARCLGGAGR